jgi:hypothetical protein
VLTDPLSRPVQVGVLEAGKILIQYEGVTSTQVDELEGLAGSDVVVAPGTELPDPIVATAWLAKLRCSTVDSAALGEFVTAHAGQGPGSHG